MDGTESQGAGEGVTHMAKRTVTVNERAMNGLSSLESVFEDMRVMLEARKADYLASAERINEILSSMSPKPRVGRPPKARHA